MRKLSHVLTIAGMAACLATPTASLAASNQAHAGFTNASGATYVNSTRYTLGGVGTDIGTEVAISNQLGLMLGYRTATVNSSRNISYTDIGMRHRMDANTSTYFSANKASVANNSETLYMLGAIHHISLGAASHLALKAGTSSSNLWDDLEFGVDLSLPVVDTLVLNLGYTSTVTSLGKTSTKATSSGFSLSINSHF